MWVGLDRLALQIGPFSMGTRTNHGDISLCNCSCRKLTNRKGRMASIAQNLVPDRRHRGGDVYFIGRPVTLFCSYHATLCFVTYIIRIISLFMENSQVI